MTALASRETDTTTTSSRGFGYFVVPLLVAIVAVAGAYATYRVFLTTSLGQLVDTAALRGGDVNHPKVVAVLSKALNGTTLVSVVAVCILAAIIGVLRKRIDLAIGAAVMVLGANASTELLKRGLHRANLDNFPAPNSFPSGHTAAAASVAFALMMVLPHAVRGTVALAGFAYVTIIAIATVWAEWHRPSDTVAAILIVLAWGAVAVFGIRLGRLSTPGPAERPNRLATFPLLLVTALMTVAALAGLIAVAMSERVTPHLVSGRFAFLTGSVVITAAAAGAFLLWVRLAALDSRTKGNLK